jgi:hypothetical protein
MSHPVPPVPPGRPVASAAPSAAVPTSGAWAGVAVLAYGALVLCVNVLYLAVAYTGPRFVEFAALNMEAQASGQGDVEHVRPFVELLREVPALLDAAVLLPGWTGVGLAVPLMLAGAMLLAGSRAGRTASAFLLGLQALRVVAVAVYTVVRVGPLVGAWQERMLELVEAISRSTGQPMPQMPFLGTAESMLVNLVSVCVMEGANLAVLGVLLWFVLRAPTRRWVEARGRRRPSSAPV